MQNQPLSSRPLNVQLAVFASALQSATVRNDMDCLAVVQDWGQSRLDQVAKLQEQNAALTVELSNLKTVSTKAKKK